MHLDRFVKVLLLAIALLLSVVVFRPLIQPPAVRAQSGDGYPFYIEPGYINLRKPDGSMQVYGKMVIDMRNGDVWGFPTWSQSPYPVDPTQTKPPKSSPIYLGRFAFDQVTR